MRVIKVECHGKVAPYWGQDRQGTRAILGGRDGKIDLRALAAGIATIAIGAYAAVIVAYHFLPALSDYTLLSMRWFWDLSFYLQLGCYFLVGLFHVARVADAVQGKKLWAIWKMLLALGFMSVPAIALVVAIANDWLASEPPTSVFMAFCIALPALWIMGDLLVPAVRAILRKRRGQPWHGRKRSLWATSPLALLVVIAIVDLPQGGLNFLIALPFLCYLQGSIGYFDRAFWPERKAEEHQEMNVQTLSSSN